MTIPSQIGSAGAHPRGGADATVGPQPGARPQVAVQDVSRVFGDVRAVDSVSLDVDRGAFVSILGPSGCGKTTLLRIIVGLERPNQGRVLIDGVDVTGLPPNRRPTNLVFQHGALFPHLSVFDNVAYGLKRKGWKPAQMRGRVEQLLALTQLDGLESRRPSQLSGGQARRVGLARALAPEPAVLLLDEPLSALDLKLRKEMQLQLRRIHQEVGTTFVYVTHDQEEALVMSDRIVLMRAGRIVQDSTPKDIYSDPTSVFVAGFIGETNLLAASVAEVGPGEAALRLDSGEVVRARLEGSTFSTSSRCVLSVRPEVIGLNRAHGDGATNSLSGEVTESIYLGNHVRVRVRTASGTCVWVHVPPSDPASTSRERDVVTFSWRIEDARVLAPDPAGEGERLTAAGDRL